MNKITLSLATAALLTSTTALAGGPYINDEYVINEIVKGMENAEEASSRFMLWIAGLMFSAGIILGVIQGWIGYLIGKGRGRGALGFCLGFLFSAVGWLVVAIIEPTDEIRVERELRIRKLMMEMK